MQKTAADYYMDGVVKTLDSLDVDPIIKSAALHSLKKIASEETPAAPKTPDFPEDMELERIQANKYWNVQKKINEARELGQLTGGALLLASLGYGAYGLTGGRDED